MKHSYRKSVAHSMRSMRRARRSRPPRFRFENLEQRTMLDGSGLEAVSPWQNPVFRLDVNSDGIVAPVDALVIINELAVGGARSLDEPLMALADVARGADQAQAVEGQFFDVNGDRHVSPLDALQIINRLNGTDPLMAYSLHVIDLNGDEVNQITIGSDFRLEARVEDLRDAAPDEPPGVFAGYVDVQYDSNRVSVDPGPPLAVVVFGPKFQNGKFADIDTAGLVDETGAFSPELTRGGQQLLWSLTFQANALGTVNFTPNPADVLPDHDSLLHGINNAIPASDIDYIGTTLEVVASPLPIIAVSDVTVTEGDTGTINAVFNVTLSSASNDPITVVFATAANTALFPADFVFQSGTLTFAPDATSLPVTVAVNGDTLVEGPESFFLTLTNSANAVIGDPQGVGTILDNEVPALLSINDVQLDEPDFGQANMTFIVTLNGPVTQQVTVGFATEDDTAVAGANRDYLAQTGVLTFAPGVTTRTITIPILGDGEDEVDESFKVNLSSPTGAIISDQQGVGTIVDTDQQGISIGDTTVVEGTAGTSSAVFTLTLSSISLIPITVAFATANDTAVAPGDYSSANGIATFAAGSTNTTISIAISGDTEIEPNEQFFVNLSNSVGANIADAQGIGTILDDDGTVTKFAQIRLEVTNLAGAPIGGPINVGDDFLLRAHVLDLRPIAERQGVFGAFLDVNFNTGPAAIDGAIVPGPNYPNNSSGSTATPGLIDEVGGIDGLSVLGPAEQLLFSIPFTAASVGLVNFTGDPADLLPDHHLLLFGSDNPVPANQINYLNTSIQIGSNFFTVDDVSVVEGNGSTMEAVFTITRTFPTAAPASVVVSTSNGTATAGSDYVALPATTLTFDVGTNSRTVTVVTNGDTLNEANETFFLNLTGSANAVVGDPQGVGTIQNDDAPPTVSIADATGQESSTANFTVSLSTASGQAVLVTFATSDLAVANAATAGVDYDVTTGTLTFAAGQTTATISVPLKADLLVEPNEVFQVSLTGSPNATIADGTAIGTITNALPAGIQGFVYVDVDDDGVKDANEGGIKDVLITVTQPGTGFVPQTVRTAADGSYGFVGLLAGTYTITETQPGFFIDGRETPSTPFNDQFRGVSVTAGGVAGPFNFGERGLRPQFVSAFLNRRAFFASSIETGISGPSSPGTNMDLRRGDVFISFDGGWNGLRRIETNFQSIQGSVTMQLFDVNFNLLATSAPEVDHAQIEFVGTLGQTYFMKITGTNPDVDLVITELLSINNVTVVEGNTGTTNAVFNVTLSGPLVDTVIVNFTTNPGTATAPDDFVAKTGAITFSPGQLLQTITVEVTGDTVGEPNENFTVSLSGAVAAEIGDADGAGTIRDDDLVGLALAEAVFGEKDDDWMA